MTKIFLLDIYHKFSVKYYSSGKTNKCLAFQKNKNKLHIIWIYSNLKIRQIVWRLLQAFIFMYVSGLT